MSKNQKSLNSVNLFKQVMYNLHATFVTAAIVAQEKKKTAKDKVESKRYTRSNSVCEAMIAQFLFSEQDCDMKKSTLAEMSDIRYSEKTEKTRNLRESKWVCTNVVAAFKAINLIDTQNGHYQINKQFANLIMSNQKLINFDNLTFSK